MPPPIIQDMEGKGANPKPAPEPEHYGQCNQRLVEVYFMWEDYAVSNAQDVPEGRPGEFRGGQVRLGAESEDHGRATGRKPLSAGRRRLQHRRAHGRGRRGDGGWRTCAERRGAGAGGGRAAKWRSGTNTVQHALAS